MTRFEHLTAVYIRVVISLLPTQKTLNKQRISTMKALHYNFHPFQVVSRYRDPQLQIGENYSYLLNSGVNIVISVILPVVCLSGQRM